MTTSISYPALDQAWELYDADRIKEAAEMARRALVDDPREIDALVVFALCTPVIAEKVALLREAKLLGEIKHAVALVHLENSGFWSDLDTRPYMRACHNLALVLWDTADAADHVEAVRIAQHLHNINPNDNQGIRFLLMNWLPTLSKWKALAALLRQVDFEQRTETLYTRALSAFHDHADNAAIWLDVARETNPYVPALLIGAKPNATEGDSVTYRGRDEAQSYAHHAYDAWASVPGAHTWIGMGDRKTHVTPE